MRYLFLLLCISSWWNCQQSSIDPTSTTTAASEIELMVSETPIVLNRSCTSKTVRIRTYSPLSASVRKGILKISVDEELLDTKALVEQLHFFEIELPMDKAFQELRLEAEFENGVRESKKVAVQEVTAGDEITIVQHELNIPRPIHILKRSCWPDYEGTAIPPGEDLTINYELIKQDKVSDTQLIRTIELKAVELVNEEYGKRYSISPGLSYQYEASNWLDLETSSESKGTKNLASAMANTVKNVAERNALPAQDVQFSLGISSAEGGRPDYQVIAYEYGTVIKGTIGQCTELDTISTENIVLPEYFQIGLSCN